MSHDPDLEEDLRNLIAELQQLAKLGWIVIGALFFIILIHIIGAT